ncbi:hypothetical protein ADEAN_000431500 [Angomonas deanei]|uniref:Uncharacterized protein n=1 Tax=Angomonas deanei TaxID=59799 RepID=A0A7G2CD17_9TRYP|nr:hypothetical protein ADEAN_000431500 [Angomonas deanei]
MSNIIFPFLSEFFSDKENASQCFTTLEHTYLWKTRNVSSVIVIDSFCLLDFIRLYVRHHQKDENEKEEWIVLSGSLLSWEDVGQLFFDLLKEKLLLEYKLLKVHFVWNSVEWEAHWPDLQLCSEPNQNHHHHYPTSLEYNVFSLWAQEAMAAVRAEFPDRVQVSLTPRHVEQLLPSGIQQEDENKPPCNVQNINSTATLMTAQEEMTTLNHFFNVRRTTKKPFNVFKNAQNEYHFPYVGNMKSLSEVTYTYQYVYPCVLVWISTTSFMQYNNENNNNPNPNPAHSLEYFFYSPIQNRMNTDTPPNGEFADYIPHPPQICVNGAQFLLNSFLAKYTIQNKPFEPSADPLWWYKFGEVNQRISTEEAEKDNTNHNENENALEKTFFRLFLHPQLKTFCPKVLAKKIGLRTSNIIIIKMRMRIREP